MPGPADLMAALQAKQAGRGPGAAAARAAAMAAPQPKKQEEEAAVKIPDGKLFHFIPEKEEFLFDLNKQEPILTEDKFGNADVDILVPLAPCIYRMTDYTIAKKQPIELRRCILKLGVLRCLQRECKNINNLLWSRLGPAEELDFASLDLDGDGGDDDGGNGNNSNDKTGAGGSIEEDELGKARFMELLSNCGEF